MIVLSTTLLYTTLKHDIFPISQEMETRKLLAEIQREFREAQKELTRLTPKKSPHSPAADGGSHNWKGALSEAGGHGASTCVKRKPGRPRKTDKDVESLKISGEF